MGRAGITGVYIWGMRDPPLPTVELMGIKGITGLANVGAGTLLCPSVGELKIENRRKKLDKLNWFWLAPTTGAADDAAPDTIGATAAGFTPVNADDAVPGVSG